MNAVLTTITSVWQRPQMLPLWYEALRDFGNANVHHLIFFVGESAPAWLHHDERFEVVEVPGPPGDSIGHFHNCGAKRVSSEWIMKLDVDTLPHQFFFEALLDKIATARPREWFNVGMFYLNRSTSDRLTKENLQWGKILRWFENLGAYTQVSGSFPAGTNFVCRRQSYLDLGGCDERFKGYGWEDYAQIYLLESHWRGGDALPGAVNSANVTFRCREELSRAKAKTLWINDKRLCLFHRWHPRTSSFGYRNHIDKNKEVLMGVISLVKSQIV